MLLFSDLLNAEGDLQLQHHQRGTAYSILGQHVLGAGLALAGCFITPLGGWKVATLTLSFAIHWWGRSRLDRLKDETKLLNDVVSARDMARLDGIDAVVQAQLATLSGQLQVLQGQATPTGQNQPLLPAASEPIRQFNWDELRLIPNKHPHIIVLGESGSGKTELGEWIVDLIGQGCDVKVLTTKQKRCQWRGMPVVGIGRDFPAIERDLQLLLSQMTERSKDIDSVEQKVSLVRAIDELPAIAENIIGAADPKTGKYKGLATYTKPLVLEARETKIRLILHAQGKQVKLLGFEGMSDCLDSLTHIRLGDAALKHAKTLHRQNEITDAEYSWLKSQNRPVLVGDIPAQFLIESGWQPSGSYTVNTSSSSIPNSTSNSIQNSTLNSPHSGLEKLSENHGLDALFGKNPFPEPGDPNYIELMKELFPEMTNEQQSQFIDWGQNLGNSAELPEKLLTPKKLPEGEPGNLTGNFSQVPPDKRSAFRELGNLSYPNIPLEQRLALFKTILPYLKEKVTLTDIVKVYLRLEGKYYSQTATLCRHIIAEFWEDALDE
ncbi:hypothetical protein IQ235_03960 [Oscillatoriales cyanobacterium LEGE 11467]|uniref:Uncharacterized protein n=1 Tax=Zarconia navalis LEGE 11467 TaxID=1828826 RepID=A0A928VWC6_9CYAN|nr:hypothetical protein [Zarconia navalis]MBE9039947.1 hypothetical protein [Zarconia navalis LEGE 11467]